MGITTRISNNNNSDVHLLPRFHGLKVREDPSSDGVGGILFVSSDGIGTLRGKLVTSCVVQTGGDHLDGFVESVHLGQCKKLVDGWDRMSSRPYVVQGRSIVSVLIATSKTLFHMTALKISSLS